MLIKYFGVVDLIAGVLFLLAVGISPNINFLLFFGIILSIKSFLGIPKDFASWIDLISGALFLIIILIPVPKIILIFFAILLIQKGFFSLI